MPTKDVRKYIIIPEYKPLYAMRKCYGPPKGPLTKPCRTPISVIGELIKQKAPDDLTVMEVTKLTNGMFSEPVKLTTENYMLTYDEIKAGKVTDTPAKVTRVPVGREAVKPDVIVPGKPAHIVHNLSDGIGVKSEIDTTTSDPAEVVDPKPDAVPEVDPAAENSTPAAEPDAEDTVPEVETPDEEPAAPAETETSDDANAVPEQPIGETKDSADGGSLGVDPVDGGTMGVNSAEPTQTEGIPDKYAGMTKAERKAARRAEREAANSANNG